jgi:hypothetical protein
METLSLDDIMEYMTQSYPTIYKYLLSIPDDQDIDDNAPISFHIVMRNSIILFLALRRKLGWEIWKEDMNMPYCEESIDILHNTPNLDIVHTFTINQIHTLLRHATGLLAYIALERLPNIFVEDERLSKQEACTARLGFLKAILKYRYKTNEDFDLVHEPITAEA